MCMNILCHFIIILNFKYNKKNVQMYTPYRIKSQSRGVLLRKYGVFLLNIRIRCTIYAQYVLCGLNYGMVLETARRKNVKFLVTC